MCDLVVPLIDTPVVLCRVCNAVNVIRQMRVIIHGCVGSAWGDARGRFLLCPVHIRESFPLGAAKDRPLLWAFTPGVHHRTMFARSGPGEGAASVAGHWHAGSFGMQARAFH